MLMHIDPRTLGPITIRYRLILWSCQASAALCLVSALTFTGTLRVSLTTSALILIGLQLVISRLLGSKSAEQFREHEQLLAETQAARRQVELLFAMTEMLQSAETEEDAGAVLEATVRQLLPDFSVAFYTFNNSRERLDLVNSWSREGNFRPAAYVIPGECWTLKRGKPHINHGDAGSLVCKHSEQALSSVEIPMIARGAVYGLLVLATVPAAGAKLKGTLRLVRAMADSISLALANISLRETLRAQSLRDPLTGLYNRRYMEDALNRYLSMAERTGASTAVIMLDLDNFKLLNDAHGHAKGDAVLRDVASQLMGGLRPSDVVSRYGGEEILIILASCPVEDAIARAEMLRARIEGLSDTHGIPISASFGVAAVPETSSDKDVVSMADAALYVAKKDGRNCIRHAELRRQAVQRPRLAVG